MPKASDVLLGRLIVRNQLAPGELIDAFLAELDSTNGTGLANLLVDRGVIDYEQVEKARHAAQLLQARRYLKFATDLGVVNPVAADVALGEYRRSGYRGTIADVLARDWGLTSEQNERIVALDPLFLEDARVAFRDARPGHVAAPGQGIPAARSPGQSHHASAPAIPVAPPVGPPSVGAPPVGVPGASAPVPVTTPPATAEASALDLSFDAAPYQSASIRVEAPTTIDIKAPDAELATPTETQPVPPPPRTPPPPPAPRPTPAGESSGSQPALMGTARDLVAIALRDGVMSRDELALAVEGLPREALSDAQAIAKALVHSRVLAAYQVDQLLACAELERYEPAFDVTGFYLRAPLGFGPFGPVIEAQAQGPDGQPRSVALEILPDALARDPVRFERFRQRAGLVSLAPDVHVAGAVDSGRGEGCYYLSWELPPGLSLRDALAQGPLDEATAVRIATGVALALKALAQLSAVHGAVRPENILLRPDGEAALRYIGTSPVPSALDPEVPPPCVEPPWYAAPEQMVGDPLDGRTDLYALGVTLFEAVTGRLPFDGPTSGAIIEQALSGRLPDARAAGAPITPRFAALIRVLMAAPPPDRYPSAYDLLDDLAGLRSAPTHDKTLYAGEDGDAPAQPGDDERTMLGGVDQKDLEEMRRAAAERRALEAQRKGTPPGPGPLHASPPPVAADPGGDALIGATLSGRYRILKKLGQGGMGAVYQAHHMLLNKLIALKVLHTRLLTNEESVRRFDREVKAASRFQHPNVVQIFDAGEDRGPGGQKWHYMVMEYVEGTDLAKIIAKEGALPVERALALFRQALSAVHEAHSKQIVHRDMKSDNVMVCTTDGRETAKIMDFGIAKIVEGDDASSTAAHGQQSFKTRKGVVTGTPQYMSPEQAAGDPDIDHRSDLYSLGIILYEILLGELPFKSNTAMGYLGKHIVEPPIPVKVARPDIDLPPDLERIIMKALEKKREDRFQSAGEMLLELEQCLVAGKVRRQGKGVFGRLLRALLVLGALGGLGYGAHHYLNVQRAGARTEALSRAEVTLAAGQGQTLAEIDRSIASLDKVASDPAVDALRERLQALRAAVARDAERQELIERADRALGLGQIDEAEGHLQAAQKLRETADVTMRLADVADARRRQTAINLYQRGEGRRRVRDFDEALRLFQEAWTIRPSLQLVEAMQRARVGRLEDQAREAARTARDEEAFDRYCELLAELPLSDPERPTYLRRLDDARDQALNALDPARREAFRQRIAARAEALQAERRDVEALPYVLAMVTGPDREARAADARSAEARAREQEAYRNVTILSDVAAANPRSQDASPEKVRAALERFLEAYRGGRYADEARALLQKWTQ